MRRSPFALREQLLYTPTIQNREQLPRRFNHVVLCGMGGSALAGSLLKTARQDIEITVHRDFGLPKLRADRRRALVIVCSHSGNTEEALSGYTEARRKGIPVAVIAEQGALKVWEQHDDVPAIIYPDLGLQPRHALWFQVVSLCTMLGLHKDREALTRLSRTSFASFAARGKKIAKRFRKKVAIVYASRANRILAYLWKISLNESGKVPAFSNVFSELAHNELTAWEGGGAAANAFAWLVLTDGNDDRRIAKRMKVFSALWKTRGRTLEHLALPTESFWKKAIAAFVAANTCANELARAGRIDAVNVPFIEEFKKRVGG